MRTHKRDYGETTGHGPEGTGTTLLTLPIDQFNAFNPGALGLGDIRREGQYVQALAAIYDLEGFTAFCNQVDSHLVVPDFLATYLQWLFESLKAKFCNSHNGSQALLWSSLPIFTKFMGDGLLLIWNTERTGAELSAIHNIVITLLEITIEYRTTFLKLVEPHYSNIPPRLRCGVSRGQIVSIGDDADYVGSCINIAARLQKLPGLTFAVSRRGCDLLGLGSTTLTKGLILRKVELRGIGADERIFILKDEFERLSAHDRRLFADVSGIF
jgi:class 3 adenylate cyclase